LGLNAIVIHIQGADGMFILSVCIQIFSIGMLVIGGAGDAITGIGGKLYGERDWNGMKRLFDSIFKKVLGGAALITLLIFFFPSLLARLFGADEDLLAVSDQPLRLFSLVLIPLAVTLMLVNIFLITNRGEACLSLNGKFSSLYTAPIPGMLLLVSFKHLGSLPYRYVAAHVYFPRHTIFHVKA
jgi:Na+-driven multidrug efflux pump